MGNYICAIIILIIIVIFTAVNSFTVCNICDEMLSLIDENKLEAACELWREKRFYISLFVRDAEIDVVTAEAEEMDQSKVTEDGEAEAAKLRLREAIMEIKRSESFTFESIF